MSEATNYRAKAKRLRATAATSATASLRQRMLDIAEQYDRLAESVEQLAAELRTALPDLEE
jgi:hypothetical protein